MKSRPTQKTSPQNKKPHSPGSVTFVLELRRSCGTGGRRHNARVRRVHAGAAVGRGQLRRHAAVKVCVARGQVLRRRGRRKC